MKHLKQILLVGCMSSLLPLAEVSAQRAMTVDDLASWSRITEPIISNNGQWIACRMEPWVGNATALLYTAQGDETANFLSAAKLQFSSSSQFLVMKRLLSKETQDSLLLKKVKKEDWPMEALVLHNVSGKEELIDSVRSYCLAESADWLAYQRGRKDSTLYVRSLDGEKIFQYPVVSEFRFAEKSSRLLYVSLGKGTEAKAGLFSLAPEKGDAVLIKEGKGVFKHATFDKKGTQLAFLYSEDKDSTYKAMSLWSGSADASARLLAGRGHAALPEGWVVSEHGSLRFSENASRLFFATSPQPLQRDTSVAEENRPNVQVWSWNESEQYTVQDHEKANDLKKSYQAVCNLPKGTIIQLATPETPDIRLGDEGNASFALLSGSDAYNTSSMWEGRTRSDYYSVSLEDGKRKLLLKADYGSLRLSPKGQYAYWYAETDSSWRTISLADGKAYRLTTPQSFAAWDEDNDVPDYPSAHGLAGWTMDDRSLLLYDRYDIWQFSPEGTIPAVNLTVNGRHEQLSYRLLQLDKEVRSIDSHQPQLLLAFNEKTKGSGYYSTSFVAPKPPLALLAGNFRLSTPLKAKKADALIYTSETFESYPDLRLSNLSFRHSLQLTHGGKQQEAFLWGTAERVSWLSLDGRTLEGVVYKPANFDPARKYPLLVNFYERNSTTFCDYRMPEPHRSTIDYHFYNSNDYIIFNPDVRYTDGYPGESCYNCVMPGITQLIAKGYINEKAIGAQGHSWGGYQVAYLATHTKLFAAIESGAPVVNMFSAYGGIRWGSGMARSFQYEHTQSRIGGTPWSTPMRYIENSPLFEMDKVQTPILIMHNDADGHVPWYQGVEYFVALKRLQKPSWLLNYTTEPHWPTRMANRIDFQTRMSQFFNHYLKNAPMPRWMSEGVKATEQPYTLGY